MVRKYLDQILFIVYMVWEAINLGWIIHAQNHYPVEIYCQIMYLAICVNTVMTFYLYISGGRKKKGLHNLLALGLFITGAADYFLTLHQSVLPGYILFCLAEAVYACYFRPSPAGIFIRFLLYVLTIAIIHSAGLLNIINAFGLLNMNLITVNMLCAWIDHRSQKTTSSLLLAAGFTLFAGCDYSLLVRALSAGTAGMAADRLTWVFYIPSQAALVAAYAVLTRSESS